MENENLRSLSEGLESLLREQRRRIEKEQEELQSRQEAVEIAARLLEELAKKERECEQLQDRLEQTQHEAEEQQQALKGELAEMKIKFSELSKISQKAMTAETSEEQLKLVRKYLMQSRKKSTKKKGYIRMVVTEMLSGLTLPADLQQLLEVFDDEEPPAPQYTIIEQLNLGNGVRQLPAEPQPPAPDPGQQPSDRQQPDSDPEQKKPKNGNSEAA